MPRRRKVFLPVPSATGWRTNLLKRDALETAGVPFLPLRRGKFAMLFHILCAAGDSVPDGRRIRLAACACRCCHYRGATAKEKRDGASLATLKAIHTIT